MLQIIIHLLPCSRCLLSSITSNLHTLTRVALRQLLTKVPPQLASNPKPMFGVNRTRLMTSQLKANQNPRRKIKVARARKRPPNHKKERWCLSQATTMMMKLLYQKQEAKRREELRKQQSRKMLRLHQANSHKSLKEIS